MKKNNLTMIALILLGMNTAYAGDSYIYKFVDNSGKIVYTDRLPASEKSEFTVLSSKSGTIKKVVQKELSPDEIEQRNTNQEKEKKIAEQTELQKKKDISLLSSYSNIQEIDKMKKYELDQIDRGIKGNIDNIATLKDRLTQLEESRKASPNNKNIQAEYDKTVNNMNSIQQNLDANKTMYAEREKKYDEDKSRYLQILKDMGAQKSKEQDK